jgi:hypothetical protein
MSVNGPIFVVGMPRSGTTLLRSILDAHESIAIAPETHFFSRWNRGRSRDATSPGERVVRLLASRGWFAKSAVDVDELARDVLPAASRDPQRVFAAAMQRYAASRGKRRWGEKTPGHYAHVPQILKWYPDARVIWLVRDPRAVAASLTKARWGHRNPMLHAQRWSASMRLRRRLADDQRILTVRYEDMVQEADGVSRRICAFLGEPFDPGLLDRATAQRQATTKRGPGHPNLGGPVRADLIRTWTGRLSPTHLAVVERIAARGMSELGYSAGAGSIGVRGYLVLAGWQLRRGLNALRRRVARAARNRRK